MKEIKLITKILVVIIIISLVCAILFPNVFKVVRKNNLHANIYLKLY